MNPNDPESSTEYADFLRSKEHRIEAAGFTPATTHPALYPFQADIVRWALEQGRAAIFADCGMGKSFMQVEWAQNVRLHTDGLVLIVAPIAVGQQTIDEAAKLGVHVARALTPAELPNRGIAITNYERLHLFVPVVSKLSGIVLDESSILKSLDGKTRTLLIEKFSAVPYRLCCTATPAPNDVSELANHAEFLGAMSRVEMLATFFVHDSDDGEWRLKGHAADEMWRWMARWSVFVRRPSDLGHEDGGWSLPPLSITDEVVETGLKGAVELGGISNRGAVRRQTLPGRAARAVQIIEESWRRRSDHPATGSGTTPSTESSGSPNRTGTGESTLTTELSTIADGTNRTEHRSEQSSATRSFGQSTASPPPSLSCSPQSSTTDAPSAEASLESPSSLTTTTAPARSADFSATPATSGSGCSSTTPSPSPPLSGTSSAHWVVWCDLNAEEEAVAALLGDRAVVISGKDDEDSRIEKLARWRSGHAPVLVTKPKIFGFGLNFQHCSRMLFLGLGDSFEQYYQAIRRCWRFGQSQPVDVRIVISDVEGAIADNVKRKEQEANHMAESIVSAVRENQTGAVRSDREDKYEPKTVETDDYALLLGDSCERIKELPSESVGFSIYSPPFASLYTYSSSRRDMGNSRTYEQFFDHYGFLIREIQRVTMPGRRTAVHCQQLSTTKATHGFIGWRDFRGDIIRAYQAAGWIYDGEICIDKNPQAQAIRTKSKQLMFVQKERDSSWLRPAMADYILLFRHPGENIVPVKTDVTNEEWILFAHPIWYGIRESDVLKYREAREEEDEKHICPLQLETIERCVRLWSNPGEVVLSPFAGIGSEGYVARRFGRKFIGIELKESYWRQACRHLELAESEGVRGPTEAAGLADIKAKQAEKAAKQVA